MSLKIKIKDNHKNNSEHSLVIKTQKSEIDLIIF